MGPVEQGVILFAAGAAAGAVNAIAGGGTLISFPAMVWLGRDPVLANATNAVALWPGNLAGAWGFRREMEGSGPWIRYLVWPTLIGGMLGGWLLLRTPTHTFRAIVPFLVLGAAVLLAARGRIRALFPPGRRTARPVALAVQFGIGLYIGYFGAGTGILILTTLGLLGLEDIHQMNGIKGILTAVGNGVAAAYFLLSRAVLWPDVVWLALGAIVGGYASAGIARALGRAFVERAVVVVAFVIAFALFLR